MKMRFFILTLLTVISPLAEAASIRLQARNALNESRKDVPVTWSVPLGIDANIRDISRLRLMNEGLEVPAQFTVLARWGGRAEERDKPISWLLIDLRAGFPPAGTVEFVLEDQPAAPVESPLHVVRDDASGMVIETGSATYTMSKTSFHLFESVTAGKDTTFGPSPGLRFNGRAIDSPCSLAVEHLGAERISVVGHGTIAGELEYTIRLHFFRAQSEVKVELRLENLALPSYDGQPHANDYGSQGSVTFDDFSIVLATSNDAAYEMPLGELGSDGFRQGTFTKSVFVMQESSGDEHWDVMRDEAPRLQSGVAKRASTVRIDGVTTDGPNQIAGWLDSSGVGVGVERAWQNFPKAFRASMGQIEIGLFPGEYSRDHELRAGEFKTHTMWIRHHGPGTPNVAQRQRSALSRVRLLPSVEHVSRTMAVGFIAPRLPNVFSNYEAAVDYQIAPTPFWRGATAARTVLDAISLGQSYGWVDYGDVPDAEGISSPLSMKYDALRGLLWQALRTDDETWWDLGSAAARHVADIDVHHARVRGHTTSRLWYEGGIYGNGEFTEDGRVNPHRSYLNPSSSLAGPSAGLFLWALMMGDTLLLDSATETADNIYWRATNTSYEQKSSGGGPCARAAGLQLCEGSCDGREPADAALTGGTIIQSMISAYQATGEPAYLDLVRRISAYLECLESTVTTQTCDHYHYQTIFIRNLGHYLVLRDLLALPEDVPSKNLIAQRMTFMTDMLWDAEKQQFRTCSFDEEVEPGLVPIEDNWLLSVADAFAMGATVLRRPELLTFYGNTVFRAGAANQFEADAPTSYTSTRQFVNQIGFGQMFLSTWWQVPKTKEPGRRRSVRH
jgi:hypothetical protein